MEKAELDRFDLRILAVLQDDAGLPTTELARRVGLSTSPCWRRVRRLQQEGVIRRQVVHVDRDKLGLSFVVYAYVKLGTINQATIESFERAVARWPEVVLCEMMTGAADYLLKVVTTDVRAYDDFLRSKLLSAGMVTDVQSRIVVHTVKDTPALPLPPEP